MASRQPVASRRAPSRGPAGSRAVPFGDTNAKIATTSTSRTVAARVGAGGALSVKNVGVVNGHSLPDASNGDPVKPIVESNKTGLSVRTSSRSVLEGSSNRIASTAGRSGRAVQPPNRSSADISSRGASRTAVNGSSRTRTQEVGTSAARRTGSSSSYVESRSKRSNTVGTSAASRPVGSMRPSASQPSTSAMDVDGRTTTHWWEDPELEELVQPGGTDTEADEDSAMDDDDDELIEVGTSASQRSRSSRETSISSTAATNRGPDGVDATLGRTLTNVAGLTVADDDDATFVDVDSDVASSVNDDELDPASLDPDFLISLAPDLEAAAKVKVAAICQRYEQQVVIPEVANAAAARADALSRGEISAELKAHEDELAIMGLDPEEVRDTSMVAEYSKEIFEYMSQCERETMANPKYMDFQNEVQWHMRATLVDWLLQVHLRYHLLPETLWIAVNIVDRFLSVRIVSLAKLQLVGVTAMFIAAKYEEILAPSVDEFVFMTENGYSRDEILKGERIILSILNFNISTYCSPYSWLRRISKADDYDVQTRTLSKFLVEVTLLDHRFLRARPSLIAAVGMFLAKKMLGGEWDDAFVYYSMFTEEQLVPAANLLLERLLDPAFEEQFVCRKYANRRFLKASGFAREWAERNHSALLDAADDAAAAAAETAAEAKEAHLEADDMTA